VWKCFLQLRLFRPALTQPTYPPRQVAKFNVFDQIEQFYNLMRKHTNNRMPSRIDFENSHPKLTKAGV